MFGLNKFEGQFFGAPRGEDGYFVTSGVVFLAENTRMDNWTSSPQLVHEVVHHGQSLGTLFGQFYQRLLIARSQIVIEGTRALVRKKGKLFVTLREWRDDDPYGDNPTSRLLNRIVGNADRLERAAANFLAVPMAYLGSYFHTQGVSAIGTHFPKVAPPKSNMHPAIDGLLIGALSLIESFAVYWTVGLNFFLKRQPLSIPAFVDTYGGMKSLSSPSPYSTPILHVIKNLGEEGLKMFPVAVDIALNAVMPEAESAVLHRPEFLGVTFAPDRSIKLLNQKGQDIAETFDDHWEDVHPGWRFVRVIELWKEKNLLAKCEYLDQSMYPSESFLDWLIDTTCAALKWPNPITAWQIQIDRSDDIPYKEFLRSVLETRQVSNGVFSFPFQYKHLLEPRDLFWPLRILCPSGRYSAVYPAAENNSLDALITFILACRLLPTIQALHPYWEDRFGCPFTYQQLSEYSPASEAEKASCFHGRFICSECPFRKFMENNLIDVSEVEDLRKGKS